MFGMDLKDVQNVDFCNLDIDKYLNWLKSEYELFSMVNTLPLIDSIYNSYQIRQYVVMSYYRATRNKELPKPVKKAYDDRINHFKAQIDEFDMMLMRLQYFDSVGLKTYKKDKKYKYFDAKELKEVKIDITYFNLWHNSFKTIWQPDFISETEKDFEKSPLPKEDFYIQKANMIKETGFDYLEQILNGNFIYNLDNSTKALYFFTEVSRIWEISYLEKEALKVKDATISNSPKYTLNPNFDDLEEQIKVIHENTTGLFNASIEQWKNLFSNDIKPFKNPIELKPKITYEDLHFFLAELHRVQLFRKSQFGIVIEKTKAFASKKIITSQGLSDAHRKAKSGAKHSYIVANLLSKLNLY